jgi:hypothetical protein
MSQPRVLMCNVKSRLSNPIPRPFVLSQASESSIYIGKYLMTVCCESVL